MLRLLILLPLLLSLLAACGPTPPPNNDNKPANTAEDTDLSATDRQRILFVGNSLTAGYNLEKEQAFPALIQQKIDSLGWPYRCDNAGVSGRTSSGGRAAMGWLMREPIDVFVLELGGNDGLRGIDPKVTEANLRAMLDTVRQANPSCKLMLCGMRVPPNMGPDYTAKFEALFPRIAQDYDCAYLPFLLAPVATQEQYMFPDGIHPNAAGHVLVAEHVWGTLRPLLEAEVSS